MAQVRKYNWAQVGKISKELGKKGHGRPLRYAIRISSFFQLNFQSFKISYLSVLIALFLTTCFVFFCGWHFAPSLHTIIYVRS